MDYMQLLGKKESASALTKNVVGGLSSGAKSFDLGALTKNIDVGALTKNIDTGALTKNIDVSALTKNIDASALTKNIDASALTKNIDASALTKNVDASALTKNVDASALTKNVDAGALTKNVDDIAGAAGKKAGKETSESLAKKAKDIADKAGDMLKKVDKKTLVAVGAAGGLGLYLVKKVKDMEGKKVGITKVEAGKTGVAGFGGDKKVVLITYSPALEIRSTDKIDIDGSQTTPSMDGKDYNVNSVKSDTQIYVTVGNDITAFKEGGQITLHTDFESQALGLVKDGAAAAGELAGDVAGAGAGGLLKGLGIDPKIAMYVGIGLGVLILLFILMKFMGKKKA
jgi:hypothetical protein